MQKSRIKQESPVILLVYRDLTLGRFIETVLEDEGYEVAIERHWLSALFFESEYLFHIDLVITNLGHSNAMNGLTLASCLSATRPATNFLFTTGGIPGEFFAPDQLTAPDEPLYLRRFPVLATPFSPETLRARVRNLVRTEKPQAALA